MSKVKQEAKAIKAQFKANKVKALAAMPPACPTAETLSLPDSPDIMKFLYKESARLAEQESYQVKAIAYKDVAQAAGEKFIAVQTEEQSEPSVKRLKFHELSLMAVFNIENYSTNVKCLKVGNSTAIINIELDYGFCIRIDPKRRYEKIRIKRNELVTRIVPR